MEGSYLPESATPAEPQEGAEAESEWLRRLRTDDRDALDDLARVHWSALVGFAYDLLGSADGAEDIAQEALIGLWNQRHGFQGRSSLRAYLMQSVRRLALNDRRNRQLRDRFDVIERVRAIHAPPITPIAQLEARSLSAAIEAALRGLPERRREAFVLVRFHGLSYREAAEVMGVSTQTVANHVCTALKELRVMLAPYAE